MSFAYGLQLYQKRDSGRCFPMNFAKFLRTPILQNTSERLHLVLSITLSDEIDNVANFFYQ